VQEEQNQESENQAQDTEIEISDEQHQESENQEQDAEIEISDEATQESENQAQDTETEISDEQHQESENQAQNTEIEISDEPTQEYFDENQNSTTIFKSKKSKNKSKKVKKQVKKKNKSREKNLHSILKELNNMSLDIEASGIISTDGLMIASALPTSMDDDRVGAMSASMLSLGDRTSQELSRGTLEQVLIKGKDGYVLMVHASPDTVLTVLTKPNAKLGLIFLDVKRAAKQIEDLV